MPTRVFVIVQLVTIAAICSGSRAGAEPRVQSDEVNQVVAQSSAWGEYWRFSPRAPKHIVVIAHGSIGENDNGVEAANTFIKRWTSFAMRKRALIISPAFGSPDYQTPYGGYRSLLGREYGADEFVEGLVDRYQEDVPESDGKFFLYGHSAGGQFACRYSVTRPGRLLGVVLSAPGNYAYPNADAPWPYGMSRFSRDLKFKDDEPARTVTIRPNMRGWAEAAALPFSVVVGARDLEPQPERPAQRGTTRVDRAYAWTEDMAAYAESYGMEPQVSLIVAPGVGHNSQALTESCQAAMGDAISALQRRRMLESQGR